MSLPPQPYTPAHSGTSSDRTRQYVEQPHATPTKPSQRTPEPSKPRTTNRILGDYTLSKTLGAGSMGKVKLAHHNVTGEKVCALSLPLISLPTFPIFIPLPSSHRLSLHHRLCSPQSTPLRSLCPCSRRACCVDQRS